MHRIVLVVHAFDLGGSTLYFFFSFLFYRQTTLYKSPQVTVLVMQYDIALKTKYI